MDAQLTMPRAEARPSVAVTEIPDWHRPQHRRARVVDWHDELRVADVVPAGWDWPSIAVNGHAIDAAGLEARLRPGDAVLLVRRPGDPVTLMIIGFIGTVYTLAKLGQLFVRLVAGSPDSRHVEDRGDPVYGWGPVRTDYNAAGTPVPRVYGKHRLGGRAVEAYTEVVDGSPPVSYLNLMLVVADGPIHSIGQYTTDQDDLQGTDLPEGLLIEGNAAQNFADVRCWLRLGTQTQAPIPYFNTVRTQYPVGLLIDQVTADSGQTPVVDWSKAATFDMPSGAQADRGLIGLSFPEGLYEQAGDGSIFNENVELQARYIKLDGAGNPTGAWANVSFGADQTLVVKASQTFAWKKQLPFSFFDPSTFTPPTLSNALQFSRTNEHYGILFDQAPAKMPGWVSGVQPDALTAVGVLRVRGAHTTNVWVGSKAGNFGFYVNLEQNGTGISSVTVVVANGTTTTTAISKVGAIANNTPTMVAFSYKKGVGPGGQHRLRVYLDGQMVVETFTATAIAWPSTGWRWNVLPGGEAGGATNFGELDHDEFRLYSRELGPDEVAALHADGEWFSGTGDEADLVFGFHNDDVLDTGSKFSVSYVDGQTDMLLTNAGSGTPSVIPGWVVDVADNAVLRGRYRVQVQRIDVSHTGLLKKDKVLFDHLVGILDEQIAHVGDAIIALRIRATDQLSGPQPNVTAVIKGRADCPIWDGIDPDNPTFTLAWTENPAWQLAHYLLDELIGGGQYYTAADISWPHFKAWADACAVQVYDQRGKFDCSKLDYATSGIGFAGAVYKATLAMPRPVHLVVGKRVRITDIQPSGAAFPTGDFEVKQIVEATATFELQMDWPTGVAAPPGPATGSPIATVWGVEGRHECHLVMQDRDATFWDSAQLFPAVARASLMPFGDKIRVKYDGPREPVAIFTDANIKHGTLRFSTTRTEEAFNTALGEFQNEALGYERDQVQRDDPALESAVGTVKRRLRIFDLRGIVRTSEANRRLDFLLNMNRLVTLLCDFDCGQDSAFLEPGDVFLLTHRMPAFAQGGRCARDSDDVSELWTDVPLAVGSVNLLAKTDKLHVAGSWQLTGTNPPVLVSSVEPDPNGVAQAAVFDFGAVQSVVRQARAIHYGEWFTLSLAVKVKDGLGAATVNLNLDSGNTALNVPDDGAWHTITATLRAATADVFDVECISRRLAVTQAQLVRGTATVAYAAVDVANNPATWFVAVRHDGQDALSYAPLAAAEGGAYAAGDKLELGSPLAFIPAKDGPFALGPSALATRRFQVVEKRLTPLMDVHLAAASYDPLVYPDEDAYDDLALSQAPFPDVSTTITAGAGTVVELAGGVSLVEEAADDSDTGALTKGIGVSWRYPPESVQHVARTNVWFAADGVDDPVHAGSVEGAGSFFRIEGQNHRLLAGGIYRVWVQPVTRNGTARALSRCRSASIALLGLFHVPRVPPVTLEVGLRGGLATYRATRGATRYQNRALEVWCGSPFIGFPMGTLPAGADTFGPTDAWSVLPTAADGRKDPPILSRFVGPNGARGSFLLSRPTLAVSDYGAPDVEASFEDGPWNVAPAGWVGTPALTNLQLHTPGPGAGDPQRLKWSGGSLTADYQTSAFDLGTPRRVHVSLGIEGQQVSPDPFDTYPALQAQRMRGWTAQGYQDPNHPDFAQVAVAIEWAHSSTDADPGTAWEPFRPCDAIVRSARFRVRLTRPTSSWDVWLDRLAVSVRSRVPDETQGGPLGPVGITFGDGAATVYVLEHGLGTRDFVWAIRQTAAPYELVDATVEATTIDTVTVRLAAAPAANSLRFVALGEASNKAVRPIGDGVSSSFAAAHDMGTKNVLVAIREAAAPYAYVGATVTADGRDSLSLSFSVAPAANALVLVVVAGAPGKVAVVFGDGVASGYAVQHGLNGRDILPAVRDLDDDALVHPTIAATDADQAGVTFSAPPAAANSHALIVAG